MPARLAFQKVAPEAYQAVAVLSAYVSGQLDHTTHELLKLRASIVNGCSFCVDMHSTDMLKNGEDPRRVVAVAAWRESGFFTDAERAVLALTDDVTRLGEHGVTGDVWAEAASHFDEAELAHLVLAIATINVWNRIALSSLFAAPPLVARG